MASSSITSWQIDRETMKTVKDFIFLGSKITADGDCSHEIKRRLLPGRKAVANQDSLLKGRNTLSTKVRMVKTIVFHVRMWELDHKKGWESKNWYFRTVVLEKTLESPLDCVEIKPVNPKGNQPWIFTGMTLPEAEAPILWPPDVTSWLIGKDSDAGKDWGQEENGATEYETIGRHHQLNGWEFEQTQRDSEGQESLACCSPQGHKKSDTTEWLNSNNNPLEYSQNSSTWVATWQLPKARISVG